MTLLKYKDHYWGMPVNIHPRQRDVYNKKVFADNNLQAPKTWDEFFKTADTLKAKGIVPLVIGTKEGWEAGHTFETFLISTLVPMGTGGLWTGKTQWTDPKVTDALNTFKKVMTLRCEHDYSALTWGRGRPVRRGRKGAMHIMGDWTDGWFTSKKFTGTGFAPVPGTVASLTRFRTLSLPPKAPRIKTTWRTGSRSPARRKGRKPSIQRKARSAPAPIAIQVVQRVFCSRP